MRITIQTREKKREKKKTQEYQAPKSYFSSIFLELNCTLISIVRFSLENGRKMNKKKTPLQKKTHGE